MYPKASGTGIVANPLMHEICKMAGIHDVGIKVHGSRNVRNAGAARHWAAGAGAAAGAGCVRAARRGLCKGKRATRPLPASPPALPAEVKCVFQAFDKMRTEEEIVAAARGAPVVKMPPGRYRTLRL